MNKRMLPGLRAHVDQLLRDGWWISARDPLTLKRGTDRLLCLDGMLVGSAQSDLDIELGELRRRPGHHAIADERHLPGRHRRAPSRDHNVVSQADAAGAGALVDIDHLPHRARAAR